MLLLTLATPTISAQRRPPRRPVPARPSQPPRANEAKRNEAPGQLPPFAELRLGDNAFRAFGYHMAYSPDGSLLAIAEHQTILVLDAVTGLTKRKLVHLTKYRAE